MRLVKPTINAHLDHDSPFCESCPCCLWNQIEQLAAERDRFRSALWDISNEQTEIEPASYAYAVLNPD